MLAKGPTVPVVVEVTSADKVVCNAEKVTSPAEVVLLIVVMLL